MLDIFCRYFIVFWELIPNYDVFLLKHSNPLKLVSQNCQIMNTNPPNSRVLQGLADTHTSELFMWYLTLEIPRISRAILNNVVWLVKTYSIWLLVTSKFVHYSYVMMSASWLFIQPFVQAQLNENIKALRHWPLWGEFTGDRWIPRTKASNAEIFFHLMTSSCENHMQICAGWWSCAFWKAGILQTRGCQVLVAYIIIRHQQLETDN